MEGYETKNSYLETSVLFFNLLLAVISTMAQTGQEIYLQFLAFLPSAE